MKIAGYLQTSLIEWPGKIAAVVFVPGCNFRCPFCHNADLVDPKKIKGLPLIEEKRIFTDLKKRKKWVDGICLTGGEPTLQSDLSRFLSRVKQMGFETMIETNGSRPEIIAKLLNLPAGKAGGRMVDFIAMDIKGPLDKNYGEIVGKPACAGRKDFDFTLILNSIKVVLNSGVDFEFRTTVVPTIHDRKNMVKLAKQLKKLVLTPDSRLQTPSWFLQNFQPKNCLDPKFNKIKPYSPKEMEEILAAVIRYVPGVELRGV